MTTRRNTPEGDPLDALVTPVEAWESKHYPLDLPDAVEQQGLRTSHPAPNRSRQLGWAPGNGSACAS